MSRQFLLIMTLMTTAIRASLVTFDASPAALKANLTDALSMRCAVTDNQDSDVKHLTSIFITKNGGDDDVASVTTFDAPTALADAGNLAVKGSLSATSGEGDLQLSWVTPGLVDLGDYQCQVAAVDNRGHIVQLTSSLTLTSEPPSINDVIVAFSARQQETNERLTKQQDINTKQQQEIIRLTQENNQQQSEISNLRTCASTHVAFHAAMSYSRFSGYKVSLPSRHTVVWDHVSLNQGGGYDASKGEFRCTIPGVYMFNVHIHGYTSQYANLQLEKNGQELVDLFRDNDSNESGASLSHIAVLQSGDVVDVKPSSTSYLYQASPGSSLDNVNYFMGHLISSTNCTI